MKRWHRWILSLGVACLTAGAAQAMPVLHPTCSSEVTGCDFARDGNFPAESQAWTDQTAWWNGTAGTVTVDLGASRWVGGLTVSLDNNDSYLVEGSLDGNTWTQMLTVSANQGSVGWGMDTFSTVVGNAQYDASLLFSAGQARYLRVSALSGDNMYSVGEIQVAAVPEPASLALMVSGLALVGAVRRRRSA